MKDSSIPLPDFLDTLTISGEVHYFRLEPDEWDDRLDKAVATGVNAIATYIPWLVHELPDGSFDFGQQHPYLNVARFIDKCAERGLAVIARPGPFVMAEIKNEGLGYSVMNQHPEIFHPQGWNGERPLPTTVDYMHPDYLQAARRWYAAVMPILAPRTSDRGGPIVAIQLDNEIGMFQWVVNAPDLSARTVGEFVGYLTEKHGPEAVESRYGLSLEDEAAWVEMLRCPPEDIVLPFHQDLGHFFRHRFAAYVQTLASWCDDEGLTEVPLLVNVHGSWGGFNSTFPLGLSQLHESWQDNPRIMPGTDYYVDELTLNKLPGTWVANAFTRATTSGKQICGVLEFEAGTGDYSGAGFPSSSAQAAPLKLQLCLAQGMRFVNYYLLTGGQNPPLFEAVQDGNDRIAITGQRHGMAAPIDPEGEYNPGWEELARATWGVLDEPNIKAAVPQKPPVTLGFVPDHYMTEYRYPSSLLEKQFTQELERFRGSGPREMLTHSLVLEGFAPDAVNLQAGAWPTDQVLALAPTPFLSAELQSQLVQWVSEGGKLLLHGALPQFDMVGRPTTTLIDALGITLRAADNFGQYHALPQRGDRPALQIDDISYPAYHAQTGSMPFVSAASDASGHPLWEMAEVGVGFAQPFDIGPEATALVQLSRSGECCGAEIPLGKGAVVVLAADVPYDPRMWREMFSRLGAKPLVTTNASALGVLAVPAVTDDGARVVHLLNLAGWDVEVRPEIDGEYLLPGPITIPDRRGIWLVENPGERWAVPFDPQEKEDS